MTPDISIIIPLYNAAQTFDHCLGSIVEQLPENGELILVDDGSTDETGNRCDALSENDARIKAIHTPNRGPGAARNSGLEQAEGKWIAFVDADDSCREG